MDAAETSEPRIIFGRPFITEDDIAAVAETLRSGWIGTGPRVATFEHRFREYVGTAHAVAVGSCTAALHLSMLVAGIGSGDEVIVPGVTFASTASAVIHTGATPVIVDVHPETGCLDPEACERRLTPRTRAIVPVHLAGQACDLDPIHELARQANAVVVQDCAHAIETLDRGRHPATTGSFGCFSFYATKNVTTGEGGMVVTSDAAAAARIRRLSLHGMSQNAWRNVEADAPHVWELVEPGFKYNMTDIQAALGIGQLERIEANLRRREEIWQRFDEAFADLPVLLPHPPLPGTRHARHLYSLRLDLASLDGDRNAIRNDLQRRGVGTGVHYRSLHLEPYYRERFGLRPDDLPHARHFSERTLSLPLGAGLTDGEVEHVVHAVRSVLQAHAGNPARRPAPSVTRLSPSRRSARWR